MRWVIGIVLGLVAAFLLARTYFAYSRLAPGPTEPFPGVEYVVGESSVFVRDAVEPKATVYAVHGYLETAAYFTELYADPSVQLVLVQSADYAIPFAPMRTSTPAWAKPPEGEPGTIGYDAQVLLQAMANVPAAASVRVHGHSRGGAVVLEAARLEPEAFATPEVVLEAPVLPQGALYAALSGFQIWAMPLILPLWRMAPISKDNEATWGDLESARKRSLIERLPSNPNRGIIATRNVQSIMDWSRDTSTSVYASVHGFVLIADDDRVLDAASMRKSAQKGKLQIIEVPHASHFIALDAPSAFPPLLHQKDAGHSATE